MSMKLNRAGYQQLIDEDLAWLMKQPRTLERDHIAEIVRLSPDREYAEPGALREGEGVNDILCLVCTTPHHDHYVCSNCGNRTAGETGGLRHGINYCPYCGTRWRNSSGKLIIRPSRAALGKEGE